MTWYVVCDQDTALRHHGSDSEEDKEYRRWYAENRVWRESHAIWTISKDPDETGWETDSGCDGYGLTYAEAQEMVARLNSTIPKPMLEAPRGKPLILAMDADGRYRLIARNAITSDDMFIARCLEEKETDFAKPVRWWPLPKEWS